MSTTKLIKLSRIVFEGPVQIGAMTVREYILADGFPARYDAHLHGDLQCVVLRDPAADVTIYIPLRCVRSMEAADKHNVSASSSDEGLRNMQQQMREQLAFKVPSDDAPSDYVEPAEPRRRGRPRTKHLTPPSDTL